MIRNRFIQCSAIAATLALLGACKKDEPATTSGESYVVHARVITPDESTDYITTTSSLDEGEVSIEGKGIEQLGWRYSLQHNNTVFSIGYGDNYMIGYSLDASGVLKERGKLAFEKTLDCTGSIDDNTLLAIQADRAGKQRVIYVINTDDIAITKKVSTNFDNFAGDSLGLWPTGIIYRDNKVYLSAYPVLPDGAFTTPSVDTAYVAILSYPDMQVEKVLKDTRTSPIGVYGSSDGMIETENGDIYTLSTSSAAGGYSKVTRPSGILRIKNGETSFDDSYFLNFENLSGGEKMVHWTYVGNGKALVEASTLTNETADDLWASYDIENPVMKLYILNLEDKTLQAVSGVPLHGGAYGAPCLQKDGKVYVNITTPADGSYIYSVDPDNASAQKGAKIGASMAAGIYHLKQSS